MQKEIDAEETTLFNSPMGLGALGAVALRDIHDYFAV